MYVYMCIYIYICMYVYMCIYTLSSGGARGLGDDAWHAAISGNVASFLRVKFLH